MKKRLIALWMRLKSSAAKSGVETAPRLEPVYRDRAGKQWFAYANPLEMPVKRLIALEAAARCAEMCISRERLLALTEAMERSANAGKIVDLCAMLAEIRTRLSLAVEEETLLQMAACYFVAENEDQNGYPAAFQAEKIAQWRQDPDATAFFLRKLLTGADNLHAQSTDTMLIYLRETQNQLDQLSRLTSSSK